MNSDNFESMSDKELLRRIYTAQLRMMMEIEQIQSNVAAIRKKLDPNAFDQEQINQSGHNPSGFRHLTTIHAEFDQAFNNFSKHLDQDEESAQ